VTATMSGAEKINLGNIPAELTERPSWVLWRECRRNGKPTKVPYSCNGRKAKSNDPSTWDTLPTVLRSFEAGEYSGIGWMFSANGGLVGIDLDGCRNPDSGEISDWAASWIERFSTYTEISPSRTGVKLWCKGSNPKDSGGKKSLAEAPVSDKSPGVEIYDQGRYFAVTGWRLDGTPTTIEARQSVIDEFVAEYWPKPKANGSPCHDRPRRLDLIECCWKYVAKMPDAVSGQGGHNATFQAACVCFEFGLTDGEALEIMRRFNAMKTGDEPWTVKELQHKLNDAREKVTASGSFGSKTTQQSNGVAVDLSRIIQADDGDDDEPEPSQEIEFPAECIDQMPVMMRQTYDYAHANAIKWQPVLALAGTISLFGAVYGQRARDNYSTRTNLYVVNVAPAGAGKEAVRKAAKSLLLASGLDDVLGPERIGSSAGLVSMLADYPVRLVMLDEIGRFLKTIASGGKSPHLREIITVLMSIYSSSDTIWKGDAYADSRRNKIIDQPHCCLFATTTPRTLFDGLTHESLTDGFVSRLLVVQSGDYGTRHTPAGVEPPPSVVEHLRAWGDATKDPNKNLSELHPTARLIEKTPEAHERHEAYSDAVHARHGQESEIAAAIWARAPEKVGKLALIHACADAASPADAKIGIEAENWAIRLVNYATRLILQAATNNIASSGYEEDKLKLWRAIEDGMTMSKLTRKSQWLRAGLRAEILTDLQDAGAIVREDVGTAGRPKQVIRKRRATIA